MLEEGGRLDAYTCNQILGDGAIVTEDKIARIAEGMVFNIHDAQTPAICHWGVCLGGGRAAASNTAPGGMSKNGAVFVAFGSGNTAYGIFSLQSSVDTCKANYSSGRVVLKITDPLASKSYY